MSKSTTLIAIAGGIGSGKSVVSSVLRIMGYEVYDCDNEAKRLMHTSESIKRDLKLNFGEESVTCDGKINTLHISNVVFHDNSALSKLNAIVHPRVKDDIMQRINNCAQDVMFVETAILMQSNLLDIVDSVWLVTAPEEVRIERVMARNGMSREDVIKRMEAQQNQDYSLLNKCYEVQNDGKEALLPQIYKLLNVYDLKS